MCGTLLVLSGFLWGVVHDLAAQRGWPRAKPPLLAATAISHVLGFYMLLRRSPRVPIPRPLRLIAAALAVLGVVGMFYSIMVEIPFRKAWVDRGHTDQLVTDGTYALARHPGVLWAAGWIPAAAVATRSRDLLRWAPLVVLGDVLHVWFQDRYTLPRVFGEEYRRYQRTTPFLVPTRASLRHFRRSLFGTSADPGAPPRSQGS